MKCQVCLRPESVTRPEDGPVVQLVAATIDDVSYEAGRYHAPCADEVGRPWTPDGD